MAYVYCNEAQQRINFQDHHLQSQYAEFSFGFGMILQGMEVIATYVCCMNLSDDPGDFEGHAK